MIGARATKQTPSGKASATFGRDLQREAGLADAARAGQRQQADVVPAQQAATAATSRSRPMRGVSGAGRLPRWSDGGEVSDGAQRLLGARVATTAS